MVVHVIVGSGIDLISVARVEKELDRAPWSIGDGVFSAAEIHFCAHHKYPARLYAAFFAAKEATLKALGTGAPSLESFRQIEIVPQRRGTWQVRLREPLRGLSRQAGVQRTFVSLALGKSCCGAVVVLEG